MGKESPESRKKRYYAMMADPIKAEHYREMRRKWFAANKEKQRAYKKQWLEQHPSYKYNYRKQNRDRINELFSQWSKDHPGYVNAHRCATAKKYPEKSRARSKRQYNIPLKTSCEKCGVSEKLEGHHPDYDKPLEVITLCKDCHEFIHSKLNTENIEAEKK
jgi:hypothetical protein